MMFIHQLTFKICSKITGPWNIGQGNQHLLCCQSWCHTNQYSKYHINPWNSLQAIRQNRWSMKIWSQWPWPYYIECWYDKHVWCPSFFKKLFVQTNCNILLYWGINPWNRLQIISQNHWCMKIRSQWPWPYYTECWCDQHVWCPSFFNKRLFV